MEFTRATERLASTQLRATLPGVVHEHDGDVIAALELAHIREQRSDLAGDVLVDAVQAHERIEDEQRRPQRVDGLGQRIAVALDVETYARRGDDLDVEVGELAAGGARDAGEPLPDDMQRVFGREEQRATGARDCEAAQARRARRDRDGEVEREERLAALRLATEPRRSIGLRRASVARAARR